MNSTRISSMSERRRHRWRNVCAAGAALSAAMFGVSVAGVLSAGALPAGTAPTPGFVITPTSGDSSTELAFTVTSPNNACPGDSATGDFRWQTFMVPESVDAATLTYNNSGVIPPAGVTFAWPMYAFTGQDPVSNGNTAVTTGQITNVPSLGFGVYGPGDVAPGRYKVGFACSKPPSPGAPAVTERFWQQIITVASSAEGGPAQFTWAVEASAETTTTTSVAPTSTAAPTTTSTAGNTTTTVAGTTSTTPTAGGTTTTVAGATTTTVLASGGPTTTVTGSSAGGFSTSGSGSSGGFTTSGSGGALPITGQDELPVIVWGILLVVFGRMAILLARPVKVIPAGHA